MLSCDEGSGCPRWPIMVNRYAITPTDIQGRTQCLLNISGFRVPVIVVSPLGQYVRHVPIDRTGLAAHTADDWYLRPDSGVVPQSRPVTVNGLPECPFVEAVV